MQERTIRGRTKLFLLGKKEEEEPPDFRKHLDLKHAFQFFLDHSNISLPLPRGLLNQKYTNNSCPLTIHKKTRNCLFEDRSAKLLN
jgi:hypothetical protein